MVTCSRGGAASLRSQLLIVAVACLGLQCTVRATDDVRALSLRDYQSSVENVEWMPFQVKLGLSKIGTSKCDEAVVYYFEKEVDSDGLMDNTMSFKTSTMTFKPSDESNKFVTLTVWPRRGVAPKKEGPKHGVFPFMVDKERYYFLTIKCKENQFFSLVQAVRGFNTLSADFDQIKAVREANKPDKPVDLLRAPLTELSLRTTEFYTCDKGPESRRLANVGWNVHRAIATSQSLSNGPQLAIQHFWSTMCATRRANGVPSVLYERDVKGKKYHRLSMKFENTDFSAFSAIEDDTSDTVMKALTKDRWLSTSPDGGDNGKDKCTVFVAGDDDGLNERSLVRVIASDTIISEKFVYGETAINSLWDTLFGYGNWEGFGNKNAVESEHRNRLRIRALLWDFALKKDIPLRMADVLRETSPFCFYNIRNYVAPNGNTLAQDVLSANVDNALEGKVQDILFWYLIRCEPGQYTSKNNAQDTLIVTALRKNRVDWLQRLVANDAFCTVAAQQMTPYIGNPLHLALKDSLSIEDATRDKYIDLVKDCELKIWTTVVNGVDKWGNTPLMTVVRKHASADLVRTMLESGADVSMLNKDGCSAIDYAAAAPEDVSAIIMLDVLLRGVDSRTLSNARCSIDLSKNPAFAHGNKDVVDPTHMGPFGLAALRSSPEVLLHLLAKIVKKKSAAPVQQVGASNSIPLMYIIGNPKMSEASKVYINFISETWPQKLFSANEEHQSLFSRWLNGFETAINPEPSPSEDPSELKDSDPIKLEKSTMGGTRALLDVLSALFQAAGNAITKAGRGQGISACSISNHWLTPHFRASLRSDAETLIKDGHIDLVKQLADIVCGVSDQVYCGLETWSSIRYDSDDSDSGSCDRSSKSQVDDISPSDEKDVDVDKDELAPQDKVDGPVVRRDERRENDKQSDTVKVPQGESDAIDAQRLALADKMAQSGVSKDLFNKMKNQDYKDDVTFREEICTWFCSGMDYWGCDICTRCGCVMCSTTGKCHSGSSLYPMQCSTGMWVYKMNVCDTLEKNAKDYWLPEIDYDKYEDDWGFFAEE